MDVDDHLLLYTDGVSETLADNDCRAKERLTSAIERTPHGGASAPRRNSRRRPSRTGRPQPDDVTLLTATILDPIHR
jgi:hypothetical protein